MNAPQIAGDVDITQTTVDPLSIEVTFWDSIKNSNNLEDFRAYLEKFPNGQFAVSAHN